MFRLWYIYTQIKHPRGALYSKNSVTFVASARKKQMNILTHFALLKGRNLGNFASATSKGIWRSCFVYVQKRAGGLHSTYAEWRGWLVFAFIVVERFFQVPVL